MKVEFKVNNVRQDYSMKLGEGGEAFFVFETTADVPAAMLTSPLVSPVSSPEARPLSSASDPGIPDLEPLDLNDAQISAMSIPTLNHKVSDPTLGYSKSLPHTSQTLQQIISSESGTNLSSEPRPLSDPPSSSPLLPSADIFGTSAPQSSSDGRPDSPPQHPKQQAVSRAMALSKKLWTSNIPSQVNEEGDLMLDMTGYKSTDEELLRAEVIARQILSEELEGKFDIGGLMSADEKGNLWIYSSEEAKEAAIRKQTYPGMSTHAFLSADALSDPGYHSDDNQSSRSAEAPASPQNKSSDSGLGLNTPSHSPSAPISTEPIRNYAKTLRMTSEQLKSLNLKPGANAASFSVNRSTCQAFLYLWKYDAPIVISDIDGTITKSDVLGHVLNTIGRDWTHLGVAKLYTDIAANGYNIFYLTSRSVGQADTTRAYLSGIVQEGHKLPKGPVIMSPDRTIAALRREIYLRQPEVFKMACLRDIMGLFGTRKTPFYAGFGNRLTDALSYRSVNIPSTRIFTINSNSEVSLDLLSLNTYKTGYASMREIVDHFFPPVAMLLQEGGEQYTDFNYWRDQPLDMDEVSLSESDAGESYRHGQKSIRSDEDGSDEEIMSEEDMYASYMSRASLDEAASSVGNNVDVELASRIVRLNSREIAVPADTSRESIDALVESGILDSVDEERDDEAIETPADSSNHDSEAE